MPLNIEFSRDLENGEQHTWQYDHFYTRFAGAYDWLVKTFPVWRNWIKSTLPWIQGPRVLEVSFGTGYLLSYYADQFNTFGIDYNQRLARVAQENLRKSDKKAYLQIANVESLPYKTGTFNTLVNTMAFTGYPYAKSALSEMVRVLKPGGRIVMVDINYPRDGNILGTMLTNAWRGAGDIVRDMPALFAEFGLNYREQEVGGFGSVHLYVVNH